MLYSEAAHCAPLQLHYILWQHSAPLHYAAYCGNTMHHFILPYSMATHYVPLYSAYPFAAHYAPLRSALFCDNTLCTISYDCILWQITMHCFIWLYSMAAHYAQLHTAIFYGNTVCLCMTNQRSALHVLHNMYI